MPRTAHDPQYLDEHHQRISEFANDYFDDDEEREEFTNTLMERRGYQRTHSWGPPPEPDPSRQAPNGSGGAPARRPGPSYFKKG